MKTTNKIQRVETTNINYGSEPRIETTSGDNESKQRVKHTKSTYEYNQ